MSILPFPQRVEAMHDAWMRAERYGRPTLEQEAGWRNKAYSVSIMCKTPTNSTFFAKGEGDTPVEALNAAIDEAELMASAYRNRK